MTDTTVADNIRATIDVLKDAEFEFGMDKCHTCIQGAYRKAMGVSWSTDATMKKDLGIKQGDLEALVMPPGWSRPQDGRLDRHEPFPPHQIKTRRDAIRVLERLINTGEVRW